MIKRITGKTKPLPRLIEKKIQSSEKSYKNEYTNHLGLEQNEKYKASLKITWPRSYNLSHDILGLCNVLVQIRLTTSKNKGDIQ